MGREGFLVPHFFLASDAVEFILFVGVESIFQLLQRLLHLSHAESLLLSKQKQTIVKRLQ
jgi:hypothetical protein